MEGRETKSYSARMRVMSKTITFADLASQTTNGAAKTIDVGTLSPNARVIGQAYKLTTQFTGGGATSVGMTLGVSGGTANAIMTNADVFGGTTGSYVKGTAGAIAGPQSAVAVQATFTPDAGHNLGALTAGSVTVEVYYTVPDATGLAQL